MLQGTQVRYRPPPLVKVKLDHVVKKEEEPAFATTKRSSHTQIADSPGNDKPRTMSFPDHCFPQTGRGERIPPNETCGEIRTNTFGAEEDRRSH